MNPSPPTSSRSRRPCEPDARGRGFTLIELLVVISITATVVAITFPYLNMMVRSSSEQMVGNMSSNAVSAARAYAVRYKPFLDVDPATGRSSEIQGDGYSGAVAIFTPTEEIRLAENDEFAENSAGNRLELPPPGSSSSIIRNGYKPIPDLDSLRVSGRAVVLGIVRTGANTLELLPPPFAISFNRRGQMVARNSSAGSSSQSDGLVYYDSNGDGVYDTTANRTTFGGTYSDYSRDAADKIRNINSDMDGFRELPWEVFEPVIGLLIFDPKAVPGNVWADTGPGLVANDGEKYDPDRHQPYVINTGDTNDQDLLEWASSSSNGIVMFFNRFTGADTTR